MDTHTVTVFTTESEPGIGAVCVENMDTDNEEWFACDDLVRLNRVVGKRHGIAFRTIEKWYPEPIQAAMSHGNMLPKDDGDLLRVITYV